ncbi:MAG: hypothetical protein ACI4MS_06020 [Candidatus Coproplasma sp.]
MFKKWFAKYARAVSDERERESLYKWYSAKTVVSIIFYALCILVIVLELALEPYINQEWAVIIMAVAIFSWVGFAIASLCLWLSFRGMYKSILNRPAYSGEMPEVTSYRQKVVQDKKSTFKRLWWAWVIAGICFVGFIACMVMEVIRNPDSEDFGIWGTVSFFVLLAGALTIALAYIIHSTIKQQQGKTVEQQTAGEASKIDQAQGRKHEYNVQTDPTMQTFKYIFPDKQLYDEAEDVRKKYSKIFTIGLIIFSAIAIAGTIILLASQSIFGKNFTGYAMPVALTAIFGSSIIFSLPMKIKMYDVEKRQKAELEANPDYAKNLEWYKLSENFNKFKGKIYLIFIAVSIVLSWVLAILFPSSAWSVLSIVPMAVGLFINNKLVKGLRQKLIPIEREIDREQNLLRNVRFTVEEGEADENIRIYYDGDSLMCDGGADGDIVLYFDGTIFCITVDGETCRIVNFSSGQIYLEDVMQERITMPQNVCEGSLYVTKTQKLENDTCWRIAFEGSERYDPESKNLIVGNITDGLPVYRIFKNFYVQLSADGELLAILCTDICVEE